MSSVVATTPVTTTPVAPLFNEAPKKNAPLKTKMCLNYKVGCKFNGCTFAHSADELVQAKCAYGYDCRNRYCDRLHPHQRPLNKDELFERACHGVVFAEARVKPSLEKTKMCMNYKVGCKTDGCTFAHSANELIHAECMFGDKCRKNTCEMHHPGQPVLDRNELFKRACRGVVFVEPPVEKKEFIIVIDEDEYNEEEEDELSLIHI